MAGEKLARLFAEAKGHEMEKPDLLYGRVTSVSPLEIEVEGRFKIRSEFLVLSQMVKDYTITINAPSYSVETETIANGENEEVTVVTGLNATQNPTTIQIFRSLRIGDKVSMLRARKGQVYYVLERR